MARHIAPTGVERFFSDSQIIVSKTDLKGRITYCNDVCRDIAGYRCNELVGQPHSILRHPAMPRAVFKLLWDAIEAKREIFAYVVNLARNGDHYWVFAHVTPSFDANGTVVGYHSSRRVPDRATVRSVIEPLYRTLTDIERRPANAKQGLADSVAALQALLTEKGTTYDEFVLSL